MRVSITRMVQLLLLLGLVLCPRPSRAQEGGVCISEIMYHPYHSLSGAEQTGREWIELFNSGTEAVNLRGWQFSDGVYFTFPNIVLEAGAYLVVAADVDFFRTKHPNVSTVVGGWADWLSNSGEIVELRNEAGAIVDRLEYSDEGDWAQRELGPVDHGHRGWIWRDDHDGGGKSLELVDTNVSNEYGQNWAASVGEGGTPGRANSVQASGSAPLIQDVIHSPGVPRANERVTITARIVASKSFSPTVTLHYRLDWQTGFTSLPMFDDGQHGDGDGNDTIYGVEIGPRPGGMIVEFYVEAADSTGRTRTWPAPSLVDGALAQVTNALYVVDRAFNAETSRQPGSPPLYYVVMLARDRAELEEIGDEEYSGNLFAAEPMSDAQMNATFISIDGSGTEVRYQAGVRNRGNRKRADPPMSYRVNFAGDRPWKDVGALSLNSKYPHLELMGSVLFQTAGLPAADVTVVRLKVNDDEPAQSDYGRTYGFYSAVEVLDGDWAESHFPDDDNGNLYRCTYYEDGVHARTYADLNFKEASDRTPEPNDYRLNYPKKTKEAADDWSDLFALIEVLNDRNIADEDFVAEVSQVVNLEKWARFLAVDALIGNWEGGLTSGSGDDYALYRGAVDPRFWLVPHDLDTVLGQGDHSYRPDRSIWGYASVTGLRRLLDHPDVIRMYYRQCRDLAQTILMPEKFDPLVDRLLVGWVPDSEINGAQGIKQFVHDRVRSVLYGGYPADDSLPQIPQDFVIIGPEVVGSYPYTVSDTIGLTGTASAIDTRSLRVNGMLVDDSNWSQRDGTWSIDAVALSPGINRIVVQAFDGPAGTGDETERGTIDIGYDDGDMAVIDGTIESDTTLEALSGPWQVPTSLIVPAGVTLTIEPGTTLFFEEGAGINVLEGGRLLAEGTPFQRIRLTRTPNGVAHWEGLRFDHTLQDNRLAYVDLEFGDGQGESIDVQHARLELDHVTWAETDTVVLNLDHPTVTVRDSVFPSIGDAEPIHGVGLTGQERLVFERCLFGSAMGYNDIIDFAGGQRPGPILQIYDSVFLGGGDDGSDMDGADAHLEGNVFMHFNRNQGGDSTSNAIATGSNGRDTAEICVVRNVFIGNDHDVLLKEDAFLHAENNTFVDAAVAALSFGEPDRSPPRAPGRGAYMARNIFWDNAALFAHYFEEPHPDYGPAELAIDDSILPAIWHDLGLGNIDADPLFAGAGDLRPKAMSPARTMGPFDLELGAFVPGGAWIIGEPAERTCHTDATLTVCGPGITHYRYSLSEPEGAWSEERSVDEPVVLTGLQDGRSYTVYVLGKNSAGRWQQEPTASRTWAVDTSYGHLVISEILAANESAYEHEGAFPDLIELFYDGPRPLKLAGMSLSDNSDRPDRFVFPAGTTIRPGDYLVLYADENATGSGIHTGFSLDRDGEEVCLYDADGSLLDSVTFGYQLTDLSIGRVGYESRWALTVPTPGTANAAHPMGDPDCVRINEWLARGELLFARDFIELHNPQGAPVDIGGFYLTDNPITQPQEYALRPLTFIAAQGLSVFWADEEDGPGHANFRLSIHGEWIGLFGPGPREVDKVFYGPQVPDVSQGRAPDGSSQWDWFYLPTPGVPNPALIEPVTTRIALVPESADKRVIVPMSADHVAAIWNTDPAFDDSAWLRVSGAPGGVGYERTSGYRDMIGLDVESQMYDQNATCYVRIPFSVGGDEIDRLGALTLSVRYDDGFVAYLNGTEVARANALGTPQWNSNADGSNEANVQDFDAVIDISGNIPVLQEGMNVLAIQGLNVSTTSSDFLISAGLGATLVDLTETVHPYLDELQLLDGLRITELMYHAQEGDSLDYVELTNIGDVALDLTGLRFTKGIEFVFPALELAPGQRTVVVADVAAFPSRYGSDVALAGAYSGRLNDGGEELVLKLAEPFDAALARFRYDDGWYPATDGGGLALVIDDEAAAAGIWGEPEGWRPAEPTPGTP
ncbi:MAG: lamin tail domain-containing protein [Phycisphaerales bacterium]|nr:MAG: lamin tail domain-containing protein [Phycisphaerales bacterium]